MTKQEIINNISKDYGIPKTQCENIINLFLEESKECVAKGEKLVLAGFITIDVVDRDARMGRNPKTGEVVEYPPTKVAKCRISTALKNRLKGK